MEKSQQNKERQIAGFELFLKRNLRPGNLKEIADWAVKNGKELNDRFPIEKSGSYTDEQIREIFELMSVNYGGLTNVGDQKMIMSELLDCGVNKGRTLSIGCGLAPHEIYLASQGLITGEIVGIDTSENMLKRTREIAKKEHVTNAQFFQNYGSDIDYKNEFDQVLLIDSLHWMRKWKECLVRSAKALKDGGSLFLVYSIHAPVVKIDPLGVVKTLTDQKMDVKKYETVGGDAGTPRAVIFAKKEQPSSKLLIPTRAI